MKITYRSLADVLSAVCSMSRYQEWITSKIPLYVTCILLSIYQLVEQGLISNDIVFDAFLLLAQICLLSSFGYAINSFSDKKSDKLANKPNEFNFHSNSFGVTFVVFNIVCIFASSFFITSSSYLYFLFLFLSIVSSWSYSCLPLRLKERGIFGLITASLAQRFFPVMLINSTIGSWSVSLNLIAILSLLIGLRYISAHQIEDYENDLKSNTLTYTVTKGIKKIKFISRFFIYPLEVTLLIVVIVFLGNAALFSIASMLIYIVSLLINKKLDKLLDGAKYFPFAPFYNFYMPVSLCIAISSIVYSGYSLMITLVSVVVTFVFSSESRI